MFCAGVPETTLLEIKNRFTLDPTSLPIRYLGLPLYSRKLSVSDCDPLISKIRTKMNGWTHRHLSLAGRLRLISSVITGLIGFWTQAFFLPKSVIRKINSLCSSFLWHGKLDIPIGARVSWEALSFPKSEGGLGIKLVSSWNETCGLKLLWMIFFRSGSIWVAWIRNRYLSRHSFWSLNDENPTYSWMFRKILKLRQKALRFLSIQIGNGEDSFFWWDPWTPFGPLINYLGTQGTTSLGIPIHALISDYISGDAWILPPARSDLQLEVFSFISSITPSQANDVPVWTVDKQVKTSFVSKEIWEEIRPVKSEVQWHRLVWNKVAIPKHSTITWYSCWTETQR
ncbi:unnamed protein product [Microthlaspi erraticum]|uniref:Reverse transcriptase zinc-binding domain-containing protein n=1 Tax=Microthlaspi erraticum TaxID=1685480 RepID=A0A6D2LNV2_9BRAS|nr:unnamed protein product [Microthlaspi erraticum]